MSFEKSNATNFGNQKCSLEKSNAINFGNQKCHLRNQTRQTENQNDTTKTKRIFTFNHRQDIKIIEDKKRIRHSKFYL